MSLERYRDVVPDWDRFEEHAARPEPTVVRVRTGRAPEEAVLDRLTARGFRLEPLDVPARFHRVEEGPRPVTRTVEHWLGLLYVQQAVTGLAAPALGARPGERVLDLCAAPGGKTTHLAELMEDRGCLVASDVSDGRLPTLLGNLYRLRHTGVVCVRADGRSFPSGASFDRVLVDAPCSGEGTLRRHGGEAPDRPDDFTGHVTGVQTELLRRAVALARPGGVVLYVTCTFAPEENEAVVDRVAAEAPVSVEPIDLDAPHDPGLTEFEGRDFAPELRHAWRVYPHHLDSGGLFMARLRKEGDPGSGADDGWGPVPRLHPVAGDSGSAEDPPGADPEAAGERIEAGLRRLADRYGVPDERLRSAGWLVRGNSVWAHTCEAWPLASWPRDGGWSYVATGLRALRRDPRMDGGDRATNEAVRWLEGDLSRGVAEVTDDELARLLEGESLDADADELPSGNLALRLEGDVVGRGVAGEEGLRHEIPKARAQGLAEVLEAR